MITDEKILFDDAFLKEIQDKFYYVHEDYLGRKRQFFENSGGSLRLKAAVEEKARLEKIPDCPERIHDTSMMLKQVKADGMRDIMQVIFGAKSGALVTELTSSQVMFQIVSTIMRNEKWGTNAVVTSIEHPSAYDSVELYCGLTNREFRVAMANPKTGGVDLDEILSIETIVREARKINPDIYILSDAVQHAPHGVLDVEQCGLDGVTFAPYKMFGIRGCGYGYVSDRVAKMTHHKLLAKPEKEWELGTFPHPNYAAITAVVDYVCWIGRHFTDSDDRREQFVTGMTRIHLQEHSLLIHMMEGTDEVPGLRHIPGVQVFQAHRGISRPDRRDPRLPAALPQHAGYRRLPARYRRDRSYREGIRKKDTNRRRA